MDEEIQGKWERLLNPEILRTNLILVSLYIVVFEMLKNAIIERIRDFYTIEFGDDEESRVMAPEYEKAVPKNKSSVYSSLYWLKEMDAITDDDIETFDRVKRSRNMLAHEITRVISGGLPSDFAQRFREMVDLLNKIEKWWILNVEIPINPSFAGKEEEIDESGILPGPIISLQMMLDVALGSDEEAWRYLEMFRKRKS